jgi:hypothetical protein
LALFVRVLDNGVVPMSVPSVKPGDYKLRSKYQSASDLSQTPCLSRLMLLDAVLAVNGEGLKETFDSGVFSLDKRYA